ncbi:MAG: hypothetical protein AAGE13_15270 [Pseudomonadota bacterium]
MKRLTEPQWRAHPLNRFRGGMIGVLCWACFQLIFALLLLVGLIAEGTSLLFLDPVPDTYEWLLWGAMILGPFLIVPAMLRRLAVVPWLYAGYIGVTFVLMLGAEGFALNWFSAQRYAEPGGWMGAAIFALAVTIDLIVIAYLFLGARPNVIFRRREAA